MFDSPYRAGIDTTLEDTLIRLANRHLREMKKCAEKAFSPENGSKVNQALQELCVLTELVTIENSGLTREGLMALVKIHEDGSACVRDYIRRNRHIVPS